MIRDECWLKLAEPPDDDEEMVGLMRAFGELDEEDRRQVMQIVERYRKSGR